LKKGLVIKSTGSWYSVKLDNGVIVDCKIKGRFRIHGTRSTSPVAVGDKVKIDVDEEKQICIITDILNRKNYIIRKSSNLSKYSQVIAANVDQAFLIITLIYPETTSEFIDRFLVSAEAYQIPVHIVFNKIDLYNDQILGKLKDLKTIYETIGYTCYETSALEHTNIFEVREVMKNKINVVSGKSGVGKSTLINAIDSNLNIKTAEISVFHQTGKHTTPLTEMHELAFGGYIIDTPGIKAFGIVDMQKDEIYHFFREIFKFSKDCQYYNCLHTHEPNCAVKKAVQNGKISLSRYKSYLSLLSDNRDKYRR
jgi:ribosome biogenesis GTPase